MSLAPPVAVSRAAFNPLPIYIVLFCLLWSFAFVASKIASPIARRSSCLRPVRAGGNTDPRNLCTARGTGGRCHGAMSSYSRLSASPTTRCFWASLCRAADRVCWPWRSDRQRQSGVHGGPRRVAAREALNWRKVAGLLLGVAGVGLIVWHRMSVGTDSLHGILFLLHRWRRSSQAPSCSNCWRRRAVCGSQRCPEIWPRGLCCSDRVHVV